MARKDVCVEGRYVIAIDNGVTGAITIIRHDGVVHFHNKMPVFMQQSYTKKQQNISRIDVDELDSILSSVPLNTVEMVYIERPMVNPGRFAATLSAMRALEAVLICVEACEYPYEYLDSKDWQKEMLPHPKAKKTKIKKTQKQKKEEKDYTKKLADDIAKRLFPKVRIKNSDSLLMAEYGRRKLK